MKKRLVVFTGAGISAESGLKTFRDDDGLWEGYDVMQVATPQAWIANPRLVLDFYNMRRKNVREAAPNAAHYGLALLEKDYEVVIITQNIDDLHERAGSSNVVHLHGEIFKMRSEKNESLVYNTRADIHWGDLAKDGAQLRPHIVWFEEPVRLIGKAMEIMTRAEIFVVVGTSLAVYPAAGLVNYAPWRIPKYIIDKRIPYTSSLYNLTVIEKPATEGVAALLEFLRKEAEV
ncbi:MAG: NAD-dependent deacylase [Chitinophagaceae bacterium]